MERNRKKILVTGGLGFIGKSLVSSLLNKGYEVIILDNSKNSKVGKFSKEVSVIRGDVRDMAVWKKIPRCEFVYHLAAPSSIVLFNQKLSESVDITLRGLINAFNWSIENNVKKIIYPSSGSIFNSHGSACSEDTAPNPANSYGKTKLSCEYIAKIYEEQVPSLGLRIFAGYGPQEDHKGEIASVITLFINEMLSGKPPKIYGDGTQTRDFIYIDDIVSVLIKSLENNIVGVLNVGSGESVSFNQVIATINQILDKNIEPDYVPKPKKYLQNTQCDLEKLEKLLGRKPIGHREGIKKYLKHDRKN